MSDANRRGAALHPHVSEQNLLHFSSQVPMLHFLSHKDCPQGFPFIGPQMELQAQSTEQYLWHFSSHFFASAPHLFEHTRALHGLFMRGSHCELQAQSLEQNFPHFSSQVSLLHFFKQSEEPDHGLFSIGAHMGAGVGARVVGGFFGLHLHSEQYLTHFSSHVSSLHFLTHVRAPQGLLLTGPHMGAGVLLQSQFLQYLLHLSSQLEVSVLHFLLHTRAPHGLFSIASHFGILQAQLPEQYLMHFSSHMSPLHFLVQIGRPQGFPSIGAHIPSIT